MKKKNILFIVLFLFVFTCACSSEPTDEAKIDVRIALATEKYTQEEDITHLPDGKLRVEAAKGETEGAQFIVKPDTNITEYHISVSDLKSDGNIIDKSAVKVQTEIYSYAAYNAEYSNSLPSGDYPDALIPVEYIVQAKENKIEANKNQGFFVDIAVPTDAVAGVYEGKIIMDCTGKEIVVPIELKVYDFEINAVPYTKTCYLIWQDWLTYGELDSTDEKYMDYYDMMLDYNVCGYTYPHTTAEEFVTYVRKYYSKVSSYGIPYDNIGTTENDWDKYSAYMSELAKAALEDGINYFDKAYYYFDIFYDEYNSISWRQQVMRAILETCDSKEEELIQNLLKQGKIESASCEFAQSIRKLSHVIPGGAYDSNLAAYDITHCPVANDVDTTAEMERYLAVTPKGKDYYWYQAIGVDDYPQPDKTLNGYLVSARDHFWSNYELDIIGDLFWNVSGFCNWWAFDSNNGYLPLNDLYTTASHDNLSNGDGYMLYPGLPYGSEKPFASLRLVALRDGIDDNTYMGMLGERYQKLSEKYGIKVENAKELVAFINKNIISRQISKLDSQKLLDGRSALAKAIELADEQGVVFEKISVEQNEITYVIYTDADTQLKVNGVDITNFVVAGEGRRYNGKISVDKSCRLNLEFTKENSSIKLDLWTISAGEMLYDFNKSEDLAACITYSNYGSSVTQNNASAYAKNGNSVKVLLNGYDFGNSDHNEQYNPKIGFSLSEVNKKISELESIEFWVYNAETKDIEVEAYLDGTASGGNRISFSYDTLILHANSWTKITIDNFKFVSREQAELEQYTEFGLKVRNQIKGSYTLYIDDLFLR